MGNYRHFLAMIATATLAMFTFTYLNTYSLDHVHFSETRAYMSMLMGASMAVIMLAFMRGMYRNRTMNIIISATGAATFLLALWLVRSQRTVDDVSYMRAMIPHHSIAVLTSQRARITDPRVRELADSIIAAQVREITKMKSLIEELSSQD